MHVGIIMDGNRRWAKKHLLETMSGHHNGAKTLAQIVNICPRFNVDILSVYALSGENLVKRTSAELNDIFRVIVDSATEYQPELLKNNVRVKVLGSIEELSFDIQTSINNLVFTTKECSSMTLQLCLNYTGRGEIIHAVNKAIENREAQITEEIISKYINSGPDPDLIIRTGGEIRLSNFLTWQSVYSELYFTDTLWPDFNEQEFSKAIEFYNSRNRRFGK